MIFVKKKTSKIYYRMAENHKTVKQQYPSEVKDPLNGLWNIKYSTTVVDIIK